MKKKLKKRIERKRYRKWTWAARLISSELGNIRFMKFEQL